MLLLTTSLAHAQDGDQGKRAWRWSAAALTVGGTLDIVSSYGKVELNPLWRSSNGRFGMRGTALRTGVIGGTLLLQRPLLRNPSNRRSITVANFVVGGLLTGLAVRNFGIGRQ